MKKSTILFLFILITVHCSLAQQYGWQDISINIPDFPYDTVASLTDVFFINDNEGWVATNHSYNDTAAILHTMDGGETFEVQTTLYSCNVIHMLDENEGYAGGKSGFVYRTVDGGENWDFHGTILETLADISFAPADSIGYCCGLNGTIGKITKNGVTQMNSGVPDTQTGISFPVNSSKGWVCGGSIILTYFNGIWGGVSNSYPSGGYNAIFMIDSLNGWAVGDGGIIIHTSDGQNWFEQTNPNPEQNTFYDVFFLNSNEGWAVGSSWLIEHTTNGGEDWEIQNIGSLYETSFTGIHFTSPTNGFVVGTGITLLKYGELNGVGDKNENIQFEMYPNPASSVISLQSAVFSRQSSIVRIFDLSGKKLLERQIPIGGGDIEVDVSSLESGVYFCRLTSDNRSLTGKLIIQK